MKYKKMRSKFKHEIRFHCYPYLSLSMVEIFMRFLTLKETDPIDIDNLVIIEENSYCCELIALKLIP